MKPRTLAMAAMTALAVQTSALAQTSIRDRVTILEQRTKYLEKRVADQDQVIVEKDREITELKQQKDGWFDNLKVFGEFELEASRGDSFSGGTTSDVVVATAAVGVAAKIHDWVGAEISLLYEEDETPLEVDIATVTVGPPDGMFRFTGGQFYLPFGTFETNMISDPLTLEIAETRETAVQFGVSYQGISASVFAFNGDNNEGGDDEIAGYGAAIGYAAERANSEIALNLGYISDIGDSDNLQAAISDTLGSNDVTDHVPGWTASAVARYRGASIIGEYVSALDEFQAGEVPFGARGAQPAAWTVEAAYGFGVAGKDTTFSLGYHRTEEALALELPETRFLATLSVDVLENVGVALEWAHDDDYDTGDGGTGSEADTVTAQIAVSF